MAAGVLRSLDQARTQLYHFTAIVIAGLGFFTDAYDLFCISGVAPLLGRIYYYNPAMDTPGHLPAAVNSVVTGIALVGAFFGMLFFGRLGDRWGRKRVYGITLIIMMLAAVGQSLSFGSSPTAVIATLCFFRFWLGFGVGGDYPLSAVIMSEYANTKTRGGFIAAVFAMQGMGILAAALFTMAIGSIFNAAFPSPPFDEGATASVPPEADFAWRIVLAAGAVPAALTFYFRMTMPETPRFTALVQRNAKQAARDMGQVLHSAFEEADVEIELATAPLRTYSLLSREFLQHHGVHLLATAACWFLVDVAYYSQNLFNRDLFTAIGWVAPPYSMNALKEMYELSKATALMTLCATLPGYWVTVFTVDKLGRVFVQLQGFFFMTIFMGLFAGFYPILHGDPCTLPCTPTPTAPCPDPPLEDPSHTTCGGNPIALLCLYALTFFFANFGPNSTTFIIPAELFPARFRSTCHGISSAAGKLGAIVGSFGFVYASQEAASHEAAYEATSSNFGYPPGIGVQNTMYILMASAAVGFLCTFLLPETKQRSLEEISGEMVESDEEEEEEEEEEEDEDERGEYPEQEIEASHGVMLGYRCEEQEEGEEGEEEDEELTLEELGLGGLVLEERAEDEEGHMPVGEVCMGGLELPGGSMHVYEGVDVHRIYDWSFSGHRR
ncbi:hypothetical protein CLOM_g22102 [Closterium sp. NIES-68]|nr:hypothetical protein CLOM_g22102 [Closterium sp. NIES-68]GJP74445.1 hypothetical protein CLOP_g5025 [Closterium sp. NIES-67]